MNSLKHRSDLSLFFSLVPLPCLLLISLMTDSGSVHGVLKKPSVDLRTSNTLFTLPCPPNSTSASRSCPLTVDLLLPLATFVEGFSKQVAYSYSVTGGQIVGEGSRVKWDLNGVGPGSYTAKVEVHANKKHRDSSSVTVKIGFCFDCVVCDFPCPQIIVTCYEEVKAGTPITCKVVVGPSTGIAPTAYEWSARASTGEDLSGTIIGGGTSISIPTNNLAGHTIFVSVELKGLDSSCSTTASGSTRVKH